MYIADNSISSIIFTWVVCFPVIIAGKKGICVSLISLSVFIIPYLYILSALIGETAIFAIGAAMSAISIVYLWIIYVLFLRWKERILVAAGVMWLLTIPYMLLINTTLSRMLSEPVIDVWDILSAFLLMVAAFTFFVCDYVKRKI